MSDADKTVYELDTYAIHYMALCLWVRGALRDLTRNVEEAKEYQMTPQQFAIGNTLGMFAQMIASIIREGINEDNWYDVLEVVHNTLDDDMNLGGTHSTKSQDLTDFLNSMRTGVEISSSPKGSKSGKGGPGDGEVH